MDGQVFVHLRAVIVEGMLRTVQRHICIGHQPLFVPIGEHLVKRAVQHFLHRHTLDIGHFRIAIAEDEIHAVSIFIEDQLDDTERQRHIVQQAAFFQQAHAHGARLRVGQTDLHAQAAVAAQAALASLKRAAVRHGINAIVADVYDLAAVHCDSLADVQELIFRQNRQDTVHRRIQCGFHAVHAVKDRFPVAAVKI